MTENHAIKQAARNYAQECGVTYREALDIIRRRGSDGRRLDDFVVRVLIEAIEGCGIGHWAGVQKWDGTHSALITDIGGEPYELSPAKIRPAFAEYLQGHPECEIDDVDSYLADEIVQTALFGGVIYRFEARRRTLTYHW